MNADIEKIMCNISIVLLTLRFFTSNKSIPVIIDRQRRMKVIIASM